MAIDTLAQALARNTHLKTYSAYVFTAGSSSLGGSVATAVPGHQPCTNCNTTHHDCLVVMQVMGFGRSSCCLRIAVGGCGSGHNIDLLLVKCSRLLQPRNEHCLFTWTLLQVMVVGDSGLGKTTLIRTLLSTPGERLQVRASSHECAVHCSCKVALLPVVAACLAGDRKVLRLCKYIAAGWQPSASDCQMVVHRTQKWGLHTCVCPCLRCPRPCRCHSRPCPCQDRVKWSYAII
jgi:hypothetical protein